jgi:hypothetical protein
MRNQSHYHSRKLRSPRGKGDLYLAGLPGSQSCCTWPSISRVTKRKGEHPSMPSLFWLLLCAPAAPLPRYQCPARGHLPVPPSSTCFRKIASPFSLNNMRVHGMAWHGCLETFLGDAVNCQYGQCICKSSVYLTVFFTKYESCFRITNSEICRPTTCHHQAEPF